MAEHHSDTKDRVTFKKEKVNQHIKALLKELLMQVTGIDLKATLKVECALSSLSKYPLHISSGMDAYILQGFDKHLCEYIDKRLNTIQNYHVTEVVSKENTNKINKPPLQNDSKPNNKVEISNTHVRYHEVTTMTDAILLDMFYYQLDYPNTVTISNSELQRRVQISCQQPIHNWYFMKEIINLKETYLDTEVADNGEELYSLTEQARELITEILQKGECSLATAVEETLAKVDDRVPATEKFTLDPPPRRTLNLGYSHPALQIDMIADTYEIIMLVDKNEPLLLRNQDSNPKCEPRNLKVGDIIWVARNKIDGQEMVLPFILERKRMDDFAASIKDGRFHEQKFRLRKCDLVNVIYLIENYDGKHCSIPVSTLKQALLNTHVQDGFMIHCTESLEATKAFLNMMTAKLTKELEGLHLQGSNLEPTGLKLMTFEYFNATSAKSKPLTVRDVFIKMLLQLKGVSVEKALAITNAYNTPMALMNAYDECDEDSKKGELLLADLRYNSVSPRVGPAVSKIIYMMFSKHAF